MATAEELIVRLRIDDTEYDKGIGQAEKKADTFLSGFQGKAALLAGTGIGLAASALANGAVAITSFAGETDQALNNLETRFEVTEEQIDRIGGVAETVFGNNFGGNINEVVDVVGLAEQQLGGLGVTSDEALGRVAENAFAIQDAFGVGTNETIRAAEALMSDFGITSDEAFDIIAAGFRKGAPDDFLETITEYSSQFSEADFTAEQMFSTIITGAEQGVLGTDKVADAFKEARIRISAMDDASVAAFDALGVQITTLEDGSVAVDDAMMGAISALASMDDEVARNQLGAEIFGTAWEDLSGQFIHDVDIMAFSLEDLEGSTESLTAQYDNFGALGEAAQRKILVALAPLGEKLLELANKVAPIAFAALDWIGEELPKWVDTALRWFDTFTGDLGGFGKEFEGTFDTVKKITEDTGEVIELVWNAVSTFFQNNGTHLTDIVETTFNTAFTVVENALKIISKVIDTVLAIIEGDWDRVFDNILEIVSTIIDTIVTVIGGALDNIESAFTLGAEAIQSIWGGLTDWLEEQLGLVPGFFDIDLFSAGSEILQSLWNGLRSKIDGMLSWLREQAQKIADIFPGSEPKDPLSPLRNLSNRGSAIISNIQQGLDAAAPLRLNIQGLLDDINAVTDLSESFRTAANSFLGQISSSLRGGSPSPISGLIGGTGGGSFQTSSTTNQINIDARGSEVGEDRIRDIVDTSFRDIVSESRNIRLTS